MSHHPTPRRFSLSHVAADQRGLTLPELMVAMFLTLVVSATALSALQDATRTTQAVTAMSDVNQNLRVALNVMIRDLLTTGERIPTGGIAFPTGGTPVVRPGPPASAWEFDETWTTLPAVSPGDGIGPLVNDVVTDAVTLLSRDPRLDLSGNVLDIADDGSSLTLPDSVDLSDPATTIAIGDLLMLSNGNGNTLQEVTAVDGRVITFDASAESNLNQPDAPAGSATALRNPDGTWPPTEVTRIRMVSYYIRVPLTGQITSPHLIRRVNWGEERVVAIGVTNVQLTWDLVDGVDNPTGVADPGPTAEDPDNANTEHQIRKANIFIAARSLQAYSQTGQFIHSNLSTSVSLRSLAFVSRYDIQ